MSSMSFSPIRFTLNHSAKAFFPSASKLCTLWQFCRMPPSTETFLPSIFKDGLFPFSAYDCLDEARNEQHNYIYKVYKL